MKICIVGGKLQGLEATYLSRKAGYDILIVDRKPDPPAKKLADEFYQVDIFDKEFDKLIADSDAIIPCVEDEKALVRLEELAIKNNVPYLQDNRSFFISMNKKISEKLFQKLNIPYPKPFSPAGELKYPLIVKPTCESGSVGVTLVKNYEELKKALVEIAHFGDYIIQEYINGLALSLEVIGDGINYIPILTTCLDFDSKFSCKRVYTPNNLDESVEDKYIEFSTLIATELGLKGLMDTQAIVNKNKIPVMIEINARLPSQTPTVVYHATDINLVEVLYKTIVSGTVPKIKVNASHYVVFQHIQINNRDIYIKGERILKNAKNLKIVKNFFGADEAITNLNFIEEDKKIEGVATLITKASSLEKARDKMQKVLERIKENFQIKNVVDEEIVHGEVS